ncbi:MAG: hypothetical protein J6W86_03795 [Bacteroidales bacterium]|nr:hypothetical protein [Bacteroidales bacterium]
MKKIEKRFYEAPSSRVYEVAHQGVICQSGDTENINTGEEYDDDDFTS